MERIRIPLLISIFGIVLYIPSLFGQLFWDDNDFIINNRYVRDFKLSPFFTAQALEGAAKQSNYFRPIQFSIYAVIHRLFTAIPLPFHFVNIITHTAAAVAIYWFTLRLWRTYLPKSKNHTKISFVLALLFLIHPIQTEAVSYVSGLSDPLVAWFGFLSLGTFLLSKNRQLPITSLGLYVLALLSKESGVLFVGVICWLWILRFCNKPLPNIRVLISDFFIQVLPFVLITLIYLIYHIQFIQVINMQNVFGPHPYTFSPIIRIATFLSLLPKYLLIVIAPITLLYERDFTIIILQNVWSLTALISVTGVVLIGGVSVLIARKKQHLPLFYFLALGTSLLPFSGIILINGIMYEHYLYIPLVFFFGLIISLVYYVIHHWSTSGTRRLSQLTIYLLWSIIGVFLVVFSIRNLYRQYTWQNPIAFYQETLRLAPNSFRVINNLASEYNNVGKINLAIQTYERAIILNPNSPYPYHNLGQIYLNLGNQQTAIDYFIKSLEIDPTFIFSQSALQKIENQKNNQK